MLSKKSILSNGLNFPEALVHSAENYVGGHMALIIFAALTRARRLRRPFSPTFPAGGMVFFIPWRVAAEESGAANLLDLLGPP
jgi:hypothetical protein